MFKQQRIALLALMRRDILRIFQMWPQTLLPSMVNTTLYILIFGNFMSRFMGNMQGFTYIQFIIPGLIMMAVITNTYINVSTNVYGHRFQHSIDELIVSPMKEITFILGYVFTGVARGFIVGILVTLCALMFTPLNIQYGALMLLILFLTTLFFACLGFINGLFLRSWDDLVLIPTFVITPLLYLGGVFYSVKILPPVWQTVSYFNPILYLINAFRYGFLGISDMRVEFSLIILGLCSVSAFLLGYILLKRGVGLKT